VIVAQFIAKQPGDAQRSSVGLIRWNDHIGKKLQVCKRKKLQVCNCMSPLNERLLATAPMMDASVQR
jgi:hypothetical protein